METATFSRFPEATQIPSSETKYVNAGRTFVNFFDRLLFKWKTTFTVESHPYIHRIYFTNHKDWISAEFENDRPLHLATIYSYLAIKLFAAMRTEFQFQIEHSLLQIESAANLLADYVVNVLNMTECIEQIHGGLESVSTIQAQLWKLNEDRFKFEMMRQLVNVQEHAVPLLVPLKELFYDLSKVPSLHHKAIKRFSVFGVDRVGETPFCWPPTLNFRDRSIALDEKNLFQYQKVFIHELAKKLESQMQIGGKFRKTTSKQPYQFFLTLSMAGWDRIISESTQAVPDQNSSKTSVTFKGSESLLLDKIYTFLMNRLFVPEDIQGKITSGNAKAVTSVADSVGQLLVELRQHKKEACPGKLARDFWKKTGKFDPRVMKKVIQSTSAPIVFRDNSKNKRGTRKRGAAESQSTTETMAESTRQYTRNGRVVSKRRRGAFSSPARGYIPPKVKYFAGKEVGQEHNLVVFRKRFTQNKPFFNELIGHFQQHRNTTSIAVVVGKVRESKTMRGFFNYLLREARLNFQISSPKNEQFGQLLFDLVPIKHDDYMDTAPSLLRLELMIDKDVVEPPLTVIEQAIDQLVKIIIKKTGEKPVLFEDISNALVSESFSYFGKHLVQYLNRIPRNSKSA